MSSWQTRDTSVIEWLDADTMHNRDLDRNLHDIRRINAMLGWTTFTSRAIIHLIRSQPQRSWSLLDVASGSADIPIAIAHAAQKAGIELHITATDRNPQIVEIARRNSANAPYVTVEQQDALALPYPAGRFDIVMCTLALHHFEPDAARKLLGALGQVGQHVFVYDVVRSPLAYAGVVALTWLGGMHPMTRHDGPASVRRAYSAQEARALVSDAGLLHAQVRVGFPYRLMITADGVGATQRRSHAL